MTSERAKQKLPSAYLVLVILLAGAILVPFGYDLDLGPGPNRIRALIWEYMDAPWFSGVRFVSTGQVLEAILYTLPRYVFIYQVFNLFRTWVSQRWIWTVGILGALFPGLVSLVNIIGWVGGWTQPPPSVSDHLFPIYVPIPTILIMYIVLLRLFPVRAMMKKEQTSAST
jgi:hypothetical protein